MTPVSQPPGNVRLVIDFNAAVNQQHHRVGVDRV